VILGGSKGHRAAKHATHKTVCALLAKRRMTQAKFKALRSMQSGKQRARSAPKPHARWGYTLGHAEPAHGSGEAACRGPHRATGRTAPGSASNAGRGRARDRGRYGSSAREQGTVGGGQGRRGEKHRGGRRGRGWGLTTSTTIGSNRSSSVIQARARTQWERRKRERGSFSSPRSWVRVGEGSGGGLGARRGWRAARLSQGHASGRFSSSFL
jgi:hypothetical protein